jgi:hypothetical protein
VGARAYIQRASCSGPRRARCEVGGLSFDHPTLRPWYVQQARRLKAKGVVADEPLPGGEFHVPVWVPPSIADHITPRPGRFASKATSYRSRAKSNEIT